MLVLGRPFEAAPPETGEWTAAEILTATDCLPSALTAIEANWPLVRDALVSVGQGSRNSLAAAIATIAIETASTFSPVREAFWLSEDWRRPNLRYWPHYGRGLIQTTWLYNYQALDDHFGWDCVVNPDSLLEMDRAALAFAFYWSTHGCAAYADASDWKRCRGSVVGMVANPPGWERLAQIAERLLEP